jgi:hypothetical protein
MKPRRPRHVVADTIALAMHGARKFTEPRRREMLRPGLEALADLRSGRGGVRAWQHLADALNLAEALAELRIAGNLTAQIDAAQQALAALMKRVHAGAGWTLSAAESRALDDGLWVYGVQLDHCSTSEHRRAVRTVHNRIYQAARGNAGGRVVVHADPPA